MGGPSPAVRTLSGPHTHTHTHPHTYPLSLGAPPPSSYYSDWMAMLLPLCLLFSFFFKSRGSFLLTCFTPSIHPSSTSLFKEDGKAIRTNLQRAPSFFLLPQRVCLASPGLTFKYIKDNHFASEAPCSKLSILLPLPISKSVSQSVIPPSRGRDLHGFVCRGKTQKRENERAREQKPKKQQQSPKNHTHQKKTTPDFSTFRVRPHAHSHRHGLEPRISCSEGAQHRHARYRYRPSHHRRAQRLLLEHPAIHSLLLPRPKHILRGKKRGKTRPIPPSYIHPSIYSGLLPLPLI